MYRDSNYLESVGKFHKTFGQPILETPSIPTKDRCELRVSLIQEELNELKEGISNGNIVEIADALADLQYVLTGTILEFGLGDKFKDLFDEVQRSNMSKTCRNEQIAHDTVETYRGQDIVTYKEEAEDGLWLVKRAGDNKVLKSIEYSPARLEPILEREDVPGINETAFPVIFGTGGDTPTDAEGKVWDDIFKREEPITSEEAFFKDLGLLEPIVIEGKRGVRNTNGKEYRLIPADHPAVLMYDERVRQVEGEGYTFEKYDKYYERNELDRAAMCYLMIPTESEGFAKATWPWRTESFKPTPNDRLRELVKAGALTMASYDYTKKAKDNGTQS